MVVGATGHRSGGDEHPLVTPVAKGENLAGTDVEPPIRVEVDKSRLLRVGDLRRRIREIDLPKLHRLSGGRQAAIDVMLLVKSMGIVGHYVPRQPAVEATPVGVHFRKISGRFDDSLDVVFHSLPIRSLCRSVSVLHHSAETRLRVASSVGEQGNKQVAEPAQRVAELRHHLPRTLHADPSSCTYRSWNEPWNTSAASLSARLAAVPAALLRPGRTTALRRLGRTRRQHAARRRAPWPSPGGGVGRPGNGTWATWTRPPSPGSSGCALDGLVVGGGITLEIESPDRQQPIVQSRSRVPRIPAVDSSRNLGSALANPMAVFEVGQRAFFRSISFSADFVSRLCLALAAAAA